MNKQMRILIYGEGPTDVGTVDIYGIWNKGCIPHLLNRMNTSMLIDFVPPPAKKDISNVPTLQKKGEPRLEGHGKTVEKLILYASKKKISYDLIAYYGDTDKETGSKNNRVQAMKENREAYANAVAAFDKYQVKGIPIIPLRMLESWLLADPQAFLRAFDLQVSLPAEPEMLWGNKHDPLSRHPKRTLERILLDCGQPANALTFIELVSNMNLTAIETNCPISFSPFLCMAKSLLTHS